MITQLLTSLSAVVISAIVGYFKRKRDLTKIQNKLGVPETGLIIDVLKKIDEKIK